MASDALAPDDSGTPATARKVALAGLALAVFGVGLNLGLAAGTTIDPAPSDSSAALTAALAALAVAIVGALAAGWAVSRSPSDATTLATAGLTALAARFATHPDWDSIRLLFQVMTGVALAASAVVLLPRPARWGVASALVLFHFSGVLSAITSPPPTPWLTSQLWVRLFRPHLEFCYTNNAYQFYSPEPGPANVIWFSITGVDGQVRWVKLPEKRAPLDPFQVEYYRRLSLTERVNSNENLANGPPPEVVQRRMSMAAVYPLHPEAGMPQQYRMPDENARQFLASYVRHIADTYGTGRIGSDQQPVPVKSIKVYLVQHRMMDQRQYSRHVDPYAKWTYLPFFLGDFEPSGKLIDPTDPMLYWIVPILREEKPGGKAEVRNYVELHAGSDPFMN